MKLFSYCTLILLMLAPALTVASDRVEEVLAKMLNMHPFVFDTCNVDNSVANQCVEPEALEQLELTSNINIEVILDVSGSMAASINDKNKYQIATSGLQEFVGVLPEHVTLALRVYGHQGSNKEADKEFSCQSSSLVHRFSATQSAIVYGFSDFL